MNGHRDTTAEVELKRKRWTKVTGPDKQVMSAAIGERLIHLLDASNGAIKTLDITGGAPELMVGHTVRVEPGFAQLTLRLVSALETEM